MLPLFLGLLLRFWESVKQCFSVRYFVRLKTLRIQGISPHACAVKELVRRRRSRRRILNSIIKERKSDFWFLNGVNNSHIARIYGTASREKTNYIIRKAVYRSRQLEFAQMLRKQNDRLRQIFVPGFINKVLNVISRVIYCLISP